MIRCYVLNKIMRLLRVTIVVQGFTGEVYLAKKNSDKAIKGLFPLRNLITATQAKNREDEYFKIKGDIFKLMQLDKGDNDANS